MILSKIAIFSAWFHVVLRRENRFISIVFSNKLFSIKMFDLGF